MGESCEGEQELWREGVHQAALAKAFIRLDPLYERPSTSLESTVGVAAI
jgi:hypothetical protein